MDPRVERGMRRQLDRLPAERIGWKVALNAPAALERLGLEEPALGWLARERVVAGEHELAGARAPAVEPELLLEAGRGAAPARMGVALEVVDFDRPLDDVEEVLAHNVFHRAVALGELGAPGTPGPATFSVGGEERGPLADLEPPEDTLARAREQLSRLGAELRPGDLVIAGALAPAAPVAPGDVAEFSVDGLGSVRLAFA